MAEFFGAKSFMSEHKAVKIISKLQRQWLHNLVPNRIIIDVAEKKNESARIGAGNGYNGIVNTIVYQKVITILDNSVYGH